MVPLTHASGNLTTHRHAYLISSGGERGRSAAALLRSVGFSVTRLPPVVLTPHHLQLLPPRWSGRLTSNASGLQWVKRSFSCMLTQRLAYEKMARRHAANATARHRFEYIFEDDVALHPSLTSSRSLLSPLLDAAESTAHAGRADLVYLGGCRTYRRQPIGRAALWRVALSNGTSVNFIAPKGAVEGQEVEVRGATTPRRYVDECGCLIMAATMANAPVQPFPACMNLPGAIWPRLTLLLRAPTAARASRHSQFEAPTEGGAASPQATNSSPPPAEPTAADAPCEEVLEALAI